MWRVITVIALILTGGCATAKPRPVMERHGVWGGAMQAELPTAWGKPIALRLLIPNGVALFVADPARKDKDKDAMVRFSVVASRTSVGKYPEEPRRTDAFTFQSILRVVADSTPAWVPTDDCDEDGRVVRPINENGWYGRIERNNCSGEVYRRIIAFDADREAMILIESRGTIEQGAASAAERSLQSLKVDTFALPVGAIDKSRALPLDK